MSDALEPIEQREIEFYGDPVIAVQMEDGAVYVPIKPVCDAMGLSWSGQRDRISRDDIFSEVAMSVRVTRSDIDPKSRRPRNSDMLALPLEFVNGWLVGISSKRVKPEIREPLRRYQLECYRVLYEAFSQNAVTVRHDDELMQSDDPAAVAYRQSMAIAKIAREHYYLKRQVSNHQQQIGRLDERVSLIEANMSNPDAFVTQEQAQMIAGAIKLIAVRLGKTTKRNEFGAMYGRLYDIFGITSYKRMPAAKFENAMEWLRDLWVEVSDGADVPF